MMPPLEPEEIQLGRAYPHGAWSVKVARSELSTGRPWLEPQSNVDWPGYGFATILIRIAEVPRRRAAHWNNRSAGCVTRWPQV